MLECPNMGNVGNLGNSIYIQIKVHLTAFPES